MILKNKISGLTLLLVLLLTADLRAGKMEKGFEALSIYDYFKARHIFQKLNKKNFNAYASFGLATIYMRKDNPFHNLDSATKYLNAGYFSFLGKGQPLVAGGITVDAVNYLGLADSITYKNYQRTKQVNTIAACDHFLKNNFLGKKKYIYEIIYLRDELEFNIVMQAYQSDTTREFIVTHPQSIFLKEAGILYERQLFDEMIRGGVASTYIAFIKKYPKNVMVATAYEKLFSIYRQEKDVKGLREFVNNYPAAPQNLEAWKLLFSLTVKTFSYGELKKFIEDYPKFPLKNSILKELELNKISLYPIEEGDFVGFVDDKGKVVVRPMYDEASEFYEGLSVVSKNDSVFFINKENTNVFHKIYADAAVFRNGIAPVKTNLKWYFINRQGQTISPFYDEINEISGSIYVVKIGDNYGALDQYGQTIIEPQFKKLGDFKNDMANYQDGNNYGFVSSAGSIHKAEFDWISDFDEDHIAVYKQQNKFGLINALGKKLLPAEYDLVLRATGKIFVVVTENQYGFYNTEGCFMSSIAYDYQKEKKASEYSNGSFFRLIKKGEQSLIDSNGRAFINFGQVDDFGMPAGGLIRARQKNKYGYIDARKFTTTIPFKYQDAEDFSDSLAIVKLKDKSLLIDQSGKEVFSSEEEIKKISRHYYFVDSEAGMIVRNTGEVVCNGVTDYKLQSDMLVVKLNSGEIKLLNE